MTEDDSAIQALERVTQFYREELPRASDALEAPDLEMIDQALQSAAFDQKQLRKSLQAMAEEVLETLGVR